MAKIYQLTVSGAELPSPYLNTIKELDLPVQTKELKDLDTFFLEKITKLNPLILIPYKFLEEIKEKIECLGSQLNSLNIVAFASHKNYALMKKLFREGVKDCFFLDNTPKNLKQKLAPLLKKEEQKIEEREDESVGETLALIKEDLKKIIEAKTPSLLLQGESGSGKEMVANSLENLLPKETPFYRINCASLSSELLESELFGHEKGSFTGAHAKKEGLLSQAHGGWVFLDEVACLPQNAQASLLRFLESGEIRKIGENKNSFVDVKIMAATNEPLDTLVKEKLFRKDLLERLRQFEIKVLAFRKRSLKERKQILRFLLGKIKKRSEKKSFQLSKDLEYFLLEHPWKDGNIRELRNTLETLLIKSDFSLATLRHLPERFFKEEKEEEKVKTSSVKKENILFSYEEKNPQKSLKKLQCEWLLFHLEKFSKIEPHKKINKNKLARYLEISPWKSANYIREAHECGFLPLKYSYLVDHKSGLSEEVYFSEERNSFRVGSL